MRFGNDKRLILEPKFGGYEARMYYRDKPYITENIDILDIWRLVEFVQDCERLRKIEQSKV